MVMLSLYCFQLNIEFEWFAEHLCCVFVYIVYHLYLIRAVENTLVDKNWMRRLFLTFMSVYYKKVKFSTCMHMHTGGMTKWPKTILTHTNQ